MRPAVLHPLHEFARTIDGEADAGMLLDVFIKGARERDFKYDTNLTNCVNIRDAFQIVLEKHGIDSAPFGYGQRALYFCPRPMDNGFRGCSVYDAKGDIFGTWKAFDNHHALKLSDGRICDPTGGFLGRAEKWIVKLATARRVPCREFHFIDPKIPPGVVCHTLPGPHTLRGVAGAFEFFTGRRNKVTCLLYEFDVETVIAAHAVLDKL